MFDSLSSLGGPAAYQGVGALAALEASAFVGLVIPGELALLTGATSRSRATPPSACVTIGTRWNNR